MDYAGQLYKTYDLIDQEYFAEAIGTAARAIEALLLELYHEALKKSPKHEAATLQTEFEGMAGGKDGLSFGQWGRLFKQTNIGDALQQRCGYNLKYINAGRLYSLKELRDDSIHGGEKGYKPTRAEAENMRNMLELFLQDARRETPPRPPTQQTVEKPAVPQASSHLPAWTTIANPHEDIRERRFDLGIFAIRLGEIALGIGQPEYRDPSTFFDLTYLTRGLRAQLVMLLKRLSRDPKAGSVVHLYTTFGGGKTHTMLAMCHLARSGADLAGRDDVRALMNEARVEAIPEGRVAVLDGSMLDPKQPRSPEPGVALYTPWGEIAYQLGGAALYEFVRPNDEGRTAPGSETLRKMLEAVGAPSLILIDELLDYATKAAGEKVGGSYLADQLLSFMKALTQAVDSTLGSMMVLTLTSSRQEIFGDRAARLYDSLSRVVERVQRTEVTAESMEIYEILCRRLFAATGDQKIHRQVAEAYWSYYRTSEGAFPQHVLDPAYRDALVAAYPFHPELIDTLRDRWATIDGFQKTRGVLRLLALVVSNLYRRNHGAPLINVGHIDLSDPEIRQELLNHTDNMHGYDAAIGSDVAGKPDSKAEQLDQMSGGDYYRFGLCEGLATGTFMYGHMGARGFNGATRSQLWLAALQPDVVPAMAADAFDKLENAMWYLEESAGIWRLGVTPNLNMMLVSRMQAVRENPDAVYQCIYKTIEEIAGNKFGKPIIWPEDPRVVRDTDRLKLVIGPLDKWWQDDDPDLRAQIYVEEILKNATGTHRQLRNTIVFLMPTEDGVSNIWEAAVKLMALEEIERTAGDQLTERQNIEFSKQYDAAVVGVPSAIWGAYLVVVIPSNNDLCSEWEYSMGTYRRGDTLSERVWELLKTKERLLEQLDPIFLVKRDDPRFGKLWPASQEYINVATLWDYFARYDYLPMLASPQVLQATIAWGVERGLFAYCLGDIEGYAFDTIYVDEHARADQCPINDHAWLLHSDRARALLAPPEEVEPGLEAQPSEVTIETGGGLGAPTPPKPSQLRATRLSIQTALNPLKWRDFYNSVIQPLINKGAQLTIALTLIADREEGFDQDFIELTIKEGVTQLDSSAKVDTIEMDDGSEQ